MLGANPPALLVEPVHHRQVEAGLFATLGKLGNLRTQPAGGVQRGDHAVRTVESAAQRLAVQVRSDQHIRRAGGPLQQPEHVADAVHPKFPPGVVHPGGKPVARPRVLGRGRLAVNAVVGRGPDGGHVLEVGEESC